MTLISYIEKPKLARGERMGQGNEGVGLGGMGGSGTGGSGRRGTATGSDVVVGVRDVICGHKR